MKKERKRGNEVAGNLCQWFGSWTFCWLLAHRVIGYYFDDDTCILVTMRATTKLGFHVTYGSTGTCIIGGAWTTGKHPPSVAGNITHFLALSCRTTRILCFNEHPCRNKIECPSLAYIQVHPVV